MFRKLSGLALLSALMTLPVLWMNRPVDACPFCSAAQQTFSEELDSSDVAVLAVEVREKKPAGGKVDDKVTFHITHVIKGEKHLGKNRTIKVLYFGKQPEGTTFYLVANDPAMLNWSTPIALTERSTKYLGQLLTLPKEGPKRLEFFQQYLEDPEEMLARDAYDEFAKSPYDAVQAMGPKMNHDQLVAWISDGKIPASRRRLYLTMLGVCGTKDDIALLEKMIKSGERESKFVLDALISSYLVLRGPDGMDVVEAQFLKNPKAEYTDIWSTIQALRVMGQISNRVPKDRLVKGFRHMLDRPQLADLVIPDLSRWEDWESMDRLVTLFKNAEKDGGSFVRVPVLRYLMACPKPKAKEYLKELAALDPDAMKRASTFLPLAQPPKKAPKPETAAKDKPKPDKSGGN